MSSWKGFVASFINVNTLLTSYTKWSKRVRSCGVSTPSMRHGRSHVTEGLLALTRSSMLRGDRRAIGVRTIRLCDLLIGDG